MASSSIVQLTDSNFNQEVADGITLVDFYAEWCGPCRMMSPILDQVADELSGQAKIAKVDIDNNQNLAAEFKIMSVPTLIIFKSGKEAQRVEGVRTKEALVEMIKSA
jgi:thioredoxin 1